jgi:hypothetical protein
MTPSAESIKYSHAPTLRGRNIMASLELQALDQRIDKQFQFIEAWRQPKEPLLFETLRAIDFVFCRELFPEQRPITGQNEAQYHSLQSWGVNKALERLIPDDFSSGPFILFPSKPNIQDQADDLLFHCGILEKAEMLRSWLAQDLVSARIDTPKGPHTSGMKQVMVLKATDSSLYAEMVARTQRLWMSEATREMDRAWEEQLEKRHMEILPELTKRMDMSGEWGMKYTTSSEIDRYFDEWAKLYLRRMWGHDLVGLEEKLGGNQFNEYLGLLVAISGRSQRHLCFAGLMKHRHRQLDLRNLLTTFSPYDEFLEGLAFYLDADRLQIQKLLSSLTLEPSNREAHLRSSETTYPPVVRSNQENCILPMYGLEINPFLFLLKDLQDKYPRDWFEIANNREARWRKELEGVFCAPRWNLARDTVQLRRDRRTVTDIDFLAYDSERNELGLFQLKWQQPVGVYGRANRSAATNLISEANKWIATVGDWLDAHGIDALLSQAGISTAQTPRVLFIVLARYNAHFAGKRTVDKSAAWADWPHFVRAFSETSGSSLGDIQERLRAEAASIHAAFGVESYLFPLDDMAIVFNPAREPDASSASSI